MSHGELTCDARPAFFFGFTVFISHESIIQSVRPLSGFPKIKTTYSVSVAILVAVGAPPLFARISKTLRQGSLTAAP
jgi:hypothetical protein